jgi:hypothetical protein
MFVLLGMVSMPHHSLSNKQWQESNFHQCIFTNLPLLSLINCCCYSTYVCFQQLGEELNYQMSFSSFVCHIILKSLCLVESMLSSLVLISARWVLWIYTSCSTEYGSLIMSGFIHLAIWELLIKTIFTTRSGGKRWPIQSINSLGPGNQSCSRRIACLWNEWRGNML